MAIRSKGRRAIVVGDRTYYWDYRAQGRKPGAIDHDDLFFAHIPPVVRIVSEDKRFHATYDGIRVRSGDKDREIRPHHAFPVTPRVVRRLIEEALRLHAPGPDPRISTRRWWVDL